MTTLKRAGLDTLRAIALADIHGCSAMFKFGRNADVDADVAPEDVWAGGGLYTGFPTITLAQAEAVTVVSSNAADSAAGSGMRTIRLEGLGADGSRQTENVTLNGTTPVTSTKTWYRLNRAFGLTGGSGQTNAGTITIRHAVTTANVFVVMLPGTGQSHVACYTVPVGMAGLFTRAHATVSNAQQTPQEALLTVAARGYQTSMWRHLATQHAVTSSPTDADAVGGRSVPALTDITIRVPSATAGNLDVTASFELFLFTAS